jgi:hypothetical protein
MGGQWEARDAQATEKFPPRKRGTHKETDREGCHLASGIGGTCDLCRGIDYESKRDLKEHTHAESGRPAPPPRNGGHDTARNTYQQDPISPIDISKILQHGPTQCLIARVRPLRQRSSILIRSPSAAVRKRQFWYGRFILPCHLHRGPFPLILFWELRQIRERRGEREEG